MHEAKVVSSAMLAELEAIWPAVFVRSASHRFRETAGPGAPADINTLFLHGHFIVERAREAMLWAWVVGKVGAMDDGWGDSERRRAWEELGGGWGMSDEVEVKAGRRSTLEKRRVAVALSRSGAKGGLGQTRYVFSSMDGYAYGSLGDGQDNFPSSTPDVAEDEPPTCHISFSQCFAGRSRASDVFTHIAFENHECGDCVIAALVRASGSIGITSVLPSPERELPPLPDVAETEDVPHLPLVQRWQDGDFSLRSVMRITGERNVRMWTMQLLQRYRYVIGQTPASFERLENPEQASDVLNRLTTWDDVVLLCVNDDVTYGDDEVASLFRTFQDKRWSKAASWEKP